MFSERFSQFILLILFFSFSLFQSYLQSQEKENKMPSKINVTMIGSEGEYSDLEMLVINTFKQTLEKNGLFS